MRDEVSKPIIINFKAPEFMYDYLAKKAREECASMSYILRRMILESMNKEDEENGR